MSYTPNTWANGDVITSAKLNNMEQGIANAGGGGGGALFVNDVEGTLDKTWQEIFDAMSETIVAILKNDGDTEKYSFMVVDAYADEGEYGVIAKTAASDATYIATSADGYPTM